ncbi:MAG: phosphatidylglycerol lysyltransferase [Treponema sp.]|nr:phosphatidylglycerol lysyltransferase [Treponema sp.]
MAIQIEQALSGMILSASGWRGVFAVSGDAEDKTGEISEAHRVIAAGAGAAFAEYLRNREGGEHHAPLVLVGADTRPTGNAIAEAVMGALTAAGCDIRYAGVVAAPEIMAWARNFDTENCGFIYISASHNPIGHNGLKFGLNDGGVLPTAEMAKLIGIFREIMGTGDWGLGTGVRCPTDESISKQFSRNSNHDTISKGYPDMSIPSPQSPVPSPYKTEALDAYFAFSTEVAWGESSNDNSVSSVPPCSPCEHFRINITEAFKHGIIQRPLGVCCDFNGSARCVSIDRDFFGDLGIQFEAMNARPGEIAHRIVPEGESLDPCCRFLEDLHRSNPAFVIGYVPDCDGDRGNLVIWDETLQKARALEAQEVFALACVAEFAQLAWTGLLDTAKAAIAVNDPTSLRIDRIAESFGISVFRAEVGEANVVGLARKLRTEGYTVRILGEGSAGGNITHPSAVRDPLHTVLALGKLLLLQTGNGKPGLFELWCKASGQRYHPDYSLADIIASLPPFCTTGAYSPEALLKVTTTDHGALKSRYQTIFLQEWETRKEALQARYGIHSWEASAYNGMEERKGISDFGTAGTGGLKICFCNAAGKAIASIWMRGSATEPVFRIMADAEGSEPQFERDLIEWQRHMTQAGDKTWD